MQHAASADTNHHSRADRQTKDGYRDPNGGTMCQIGVMMDAPPIDQCEPKHIKIRNHRADKNASCDSRGNSKMARCH